MKYSFLKDQIARYIDPIDGDKLAAVSHHLQNIVTSDDDFFKARALEVLKNEFVDEVVLEQLINPSLPNFNWDIPFPPLTRSDSQFTFIDLFAGVGGFRQALQSIGGQCVFTSEWDKYAKISYEANYGEVPFGDITKVNANEIPDHDILCAGFPCQAFSHAGKKKGFEDTRGTLFFDIARIIAEKAPKAFFLENVKGLASHDKGRTLRKILSVLKYDLGYFVPDPETLKADDFGVPQKRERIFLIGFHPGSNVGHFEYPQPSGIPVQFADVKEKNVVSAKYYVSTSYWQAMKNHRAKHESKGNGFGYEIIGDDQVANTIVIGGMGRERNLVIDKRLKDFTPVTKIKGEINKEGIRRMTPREWARLQGYPNEFKIVVSDAQAYKQFANSVAVPAIKATALKIVEALENPQPRTGQLELEILQKLA